jgi:hypothetical protein
VSAATYVDRASPRALPQPAASVAAALAGLGAACFGYGLATDPATAWRSFHVNTLYFGGIAQGGVLMACIFTIVGARWPGPVRRIAESLGAWVPITFLLSLIGFLGREHVYPWIAHPPPGKEAWLTVGRLYATDWFILGLLTLLSLAFLRASLRPALGAAEGEVGGLARRLLAGSSADWRGDDAERAASLARTRFLAPILCLAYAFGFSMIAFDQVMSLTPTWFSNLFGAFFSWGGFLSAVSVTALLTVLHRDYPGLEGEIGKDRLHDLGKMIFAFSIFWMYLFFSQYLVIWYGNLPEETQFFGARLGSEFLKDTWYWEGWWERVWGEPWVKVTLFAWICIWVIPFWCLLGQRPKKTGWFLATIATVSAFGFWVERNVLIWPSLVPEDTWAFLGVVPIGTALGFLGAFALVFLVFTRRFPSLAVPRR